MPARPVLGFGIATTGVLLAMEGAARTAAREITAKVRKQLDIET